MKLKVSRLDIGQTQANWPENEVFAPALVQPRARDDKYKWTVLNAPLRPGAKPVFSSTIHDEYIRIPLFQYRLSGKADHALAFMLQLGLAVVGHVPQPIAHLHIVTGAPVELVYDNDGVSHMLCWVGFAFAPERGKLNDDGSS
jgi:hypothetical protein